jgi:histone H3/H4
LNIIGRPLYWKASIEAETVEESGEAMEEDAMEEEAEAEDEQDFSEEEDDEEVDMGAEEVEEDTSSLNVAAFKRLVDVINRSDIEMSAESYSCLQATTEDFLVSLIQASSRSSHFAGRYEITEEDVRFAQLMTQQKW